MYALGNSIALGGGTFLSIVMYPIQSVCCPIFCHVIPLHVILRYPFLVASAPLSYNSSLMDSVQIWVFSVCGQRP